MSSGKKRDEVEAPPAVEVKKTRETVAKEMRTSDPAKDGSKWGSKIEAIKASNMPEAHKAAYIAELTGDQLDPKSAERVPFTVWANIKNIRASVRIGMLAFPKAKSVISATFEEWETIFKGF